MATIDKWFHQGTKSFIFLRTPIGGGSGYNVQLQTREPIAKDYLRETFHENEIFAATQVAGLMEMISGEWQRLT